MTELMDPPDGGCKAWLVMLCSFIVNGVVFGIINTFGIIFVKLKENLEAAGVEDAAFKCSLVGSLAIGCTFFFSFLAGVLTDRVGLRTTALMGSLLATLGLALSATFYNNINVLYFTYGIMFGTGASLIYTPSLSVLGLYFKKHLGAVNGFVAAGSSAFTVLLSFVTPLFLDQFGLQHSFIFLSCLSCPLILSSITFTPPETTKDTFNNNNNTNTENSESLVEKFIYVKNWRNMRFVIWAVCLPAALFGYFVPFVHLVEFAENLELGKSQASSLLACIAITSGVGRLFFGKLSDLTFFTKKGNRIYLQQLAFFCLGVCTMLLTTASQAGDYKYEVLLSLCAVMGLFDGCFVTLVGPIAFDLCGPSGASQAIGSLLALFSLPMTVGPPVAGIIHDKVGSYFPAFLGAGVPPIVGSLLMFLVRLVPARYLQEDQDEKSYSTISRLVRKNSVVIL